MTHRHSSQYSQAGFTLVTAIFLLVVLAGLGAAIVTISTSQQIGSALDIQGARAYQAARAGVEWGTYQIWSSSPGSRSGATCANFTTNPTNLTFPAAAGTLSDFTVTVSCVATSPTHSGPKMFTVTAIACNQTSGGTCPGTVGSANYVERRVEVTI